VTETTKEPIKNIVTQYQVEQWKEEKKKKKKKGQKPFSPQK
jgi:hypothetical protein